MALGRGAARCVGPMLPGREDRSATVRCAPFHDVWRRDTWRAEVAKCGARSEAKVARMATCGGYVGRRGPNSIDFDLVN